MKKTAPLKPDIILKFINRHSARQPTSEASVGCREECDEKDKIMSWSSFHHISLLCHLLSVPPSCSSSLCHYTAWWLRHCRDATSEWYEHESHTHTHCLSISGKVFPPHTHTEALTLGLSTLSCHDRCIKHLFSGSTLHLRSWLNKQADFNGAAFTQQTCPHTVNLSIGCSAEGQSFFLFIPSLALSICQSLSPFCSPPSLGVEGLQPLTQPALCSVSSTSRLSSTASCDGEQPSAFTTVLYTAGAQHTTWLQVYFSYTTYDFTRV